MAPVYAPVATSDEEKFEHLEDFDAHCQQCETAKKQSTIFTITPAKVILALLLCPFLYSVCHSSRSLNSLFSGSVDEDNAPPGMCDFRTAQDVVAPKENVFRNLDVSEALALRKWLSAEERGLNLTLASKATAMDNSIFVIEALQPNKKDTLKYLDSEGDKPLRYAFAAINHGTSTPQHVRHYKIGPLPISDLTKLSFLDENFAKGNAIIPYNGRLGSAGDWANMQKMLERTMSPLGEVTMDLFGARADGFANDTLMLGGQAPSSFDGEWRRTWCPVKLKGAGSYLHVVDLQLYVDMTSHDVEDWKVLKVWYNSQIFSSLDDFVAAWKDGSLVKSTKPVANDTDWATRVRTGTGRDLDEKAGPRPISFDGPRFRVDEKNRYVSWMGWTFYLGFGRDMGLNFHDIRFKGERIIYELTPQEAMAQYSGMDPSQSTTVWLDGAFGMGQLSRALIVGYDCPEDAHYMSSTVHPGLGSITQQGSICIFEQNNNMPLSRHYGFEKNEMGATKGYQLVLRHVATVGNYDYAISYAFQLDGTMEVRFSASGYLQGGFWDGNPDRASYGTRIRETSMGALHDHVLNWKVDFDIAGTRNTMSKVALQTEPLERAWFDDDWGLTDVGGKIVHTKITNEDNGKLDYGVNGGGMYVIQNEEELNAWGVPRGYAIHPGANNIRLTNIGAKRTLHNCDWAKHHLHVLKRKESEPASSNPFNINLPGKPPVKFADFFDGEDIEQEDLVVYMNLGTHHIPRTEDSPHTLTNVATAYALLTPYNYFDADPSSESMNSVIINPPRPLERRDPAPGADEPWLVEGHVQEKFCMPQRSKAFAYGGKTELIADGDEAVVYGELRMEAEQIHGFLAEL